MLKLRLAQELELKAPSFRLELVLKLLWSFQTNLSSSSTIFSASSKLELELELLFLCSQLPVCHGMVW